MTSVRRGVEERLLRGNCIVMSIPTSPLSLHVKPPSYCLLCINGKSPTKKQHVDTEQLMRFATVQAHSLPSLSDRRAFFPSQVDKLGHCLRLHSTTKPHTHTHALLAPHTPCKKSWRGPCNHLSKAVTRDTNPRRHGPEWRSE